MKAAELKVGNIFTNRMEIEGRKSFKVKEIPKNKTYIITIPRKEGVITDVKIPTSKTVILLHETDPLEIRQENKLF